MIGRPCRSRRPVRFRLPSGASTSAWLALALVPLLIGASPDNDNDNDKGKAKARTGEQIYRQMCASCHGASGEGTDDHYPRPLIGERSVASLSKLIAKTMPEDEPGTCVGPDAEKVSAYIYDAFYSRAAQARNPMRPARIELSRLTVRQYRNALADLIGSFRGEPGRDDRRGLKGEYCAGRPSSSRRRRRRQRLLQSRRPGGPLPLRHRQPDPGPERRQGAIAALHPAARAAGPRQPVPPVLAGVPRELAGLGAGARDRRV